MAEDGVPDTHSLATTIRLASGAESHSVHLPLVPTTGFEPVIAWMKTMCPRPLDEVGYFCNEKYLYFVT